MRLFLSNHPGCVCVIAPMEFDDGSTSECFESIEPGQDFFGITYDELRAFGEKEQPVDIEFPDSAGGA